MGNMDAPLCNAPKGVTKLPDGKAPISLQQIKQIQKLAEHLAYGSISLIFQDGKLIQIDKSEKIRMEK